VKVHLAKSIWLQGPGTWSKRIQSLSSTFLSSPPLTFLWKAIIANTFHLNQQFYKLSDDGSYCPASRPPPTELSTPYAVGASFVAKRHKPSPPLGRHYPQVLDESTKKPDRETQLQWCLSHPPVPGTMISQDIRDISIVKPICVGDSCGAQVVLTSEGLVAKFFDPLYYNFENKDLYEKANVTASADKDYVAETAAYLAPHTKSF
jgi:hypothetical protein